MERSRRRFLHLTGATILAGAAGCQENTGNQNTANTATTSLTTTGENPETPESTETGEKVQSFEDDRSYEEIETHFHEEVYPETVPNSDFSDPVPVEQRRTFVDEANEIDEEDEALQYVESQLDFEKLKQDVEDMDNPHQVVEEVFGRIHLDTSSWDLKRDHEVRAAKYVLHEELGYSSEEILVDRRKGNSGGEITLASSLVTDENGEVTKSLSAPYGNVHGEFETLRPGETPNEGRFTERNIDGQHNEDYRNGLAGMNIDTFVRGNEEIDFVDEEVERESIARRKRQDDDLIVGYMADADNDVVYTDDAIDYVSSRANPDNINADPKGVGMEAKKLNISASVFFYDNILDAEENYSMKVDVVEEGSRIEEVTSGLEDEEKTYMTVDMGEEVMIYSQEEAV
ncbi:hypothetical protein ACOZ4N_00485 (plasmid) [Halorientalis pallida]|uniref:hypothetical protein n=1 Tax=Halorientalis pallida TaxID=2479928 RepID=UPI003C6F5A51